MRRVNFFLSRVYFALLCFLGSLGEVALASSAEVPGIGSILLPLVNFFIFFSILYFVAKKPILRAWDLRRESIADKKNKASRMLEEAQAALEQARSAMTSIDAEIEKLATEIQVLTGKEIEELKSANRQRIESLKQDVDARINSERSSVYASAYQDVVKEVIHEARSRIASSVDDAKANDRALSDLRSTDKSDMRALFTTTQT